MTIFNSIRYTDAYYILENRNKLISSLPHNEAFGHIIKGKKDCIIVHFIKKVGDTNNSNIVKGLILPKGSIEINIREYIKEIDSIKIGQYVSLTWNDIVYLEDDARDECSIMYTEGLVFKNNPDHVVIKEPETLRIYPSPTINHPKIKPAYYIIPKSMIKSFEIINKAS